MPNPNNVQLSKPETYWFMTTSTLGAISFLYGCYLDDENIMDTGKNLMAHAMSFYLSNREIYRFGTLAGAVGGMFSPGGKANALSGLLAAAASAEYVFHLSQGGAPTTFSF